MDINGISTLLLKISLVVFIAGNLLEMGLRLGSKDAFRGLRDIRYVAHILVWGFVIGPALAYGITRLLSLPPPFAAGLILVGMTPCAPFVPVVINKVKGDVGYLAAFMLLTAIGTIVFMPVAVPFMIRGLSVSAWTIAWPLIVMILVPLSTGMAILQFFPDLAMKMQPVVKKITNVFILTTSVLVITVYAKGIISLAGSMALPAQMIFFAVMTPFTYWFGFGLKHEQKVILSIGMSTRNLAPAITPLFSVAAIDQRAFEMVLLAMPVMVLSAVLSAIVFGRRSAADKTLSTPSTS